ncbi:MAG: efflux RND transporter permease subunit [Myxococcota bacterium]
MTTLFIKRPVLTLTLNAFVVLLGIIAYQSLNLSEYPEISVPKIKVGVQYPGASMHVIENNITFYLEDELSGISGVATVRSNIGNGFSETWLTFRSGVKIEQALIDVRDRVSRVKSSWPKDVMEPYIDQEGKDQSITMYLDLSSSKLTADELTHLANLHLKNQLQSIKGVSSIAVQGVPYVMEIKLDRIKMAGHKITTSKVISALRANQVSLAAGKFQGEVPITIRLELEKPEDFQNIVVKKSGSDITLLKDIAEIVLSKNDRMLNQVNGHDAVFLALNRASNGNPIQISKQVKALLPTLRANLPKDVSLEIGYDGSAFVKSSLSSLGWTILEACLLVLLVVFFFLRDIRATLIPLIAIPISLIGALAIAKACGFSLNTFSLLALVLAVGLVVDDAIVVVENIHRHIEKGLPRLEAAIIGSKEIAFAVVGMTLTLGAVFMPIALTGGLIGQVLVEFGVTLAAAVLVSGFVALTLTPYMCSVILKHAPPSPKGEGMFSSLKTGARTRFIVPALGVLILATALLYQQLPKRVVPLEDRGFIGVHLEPFPGSTLQTMMPYIHQIDALVVNNPNIENRFLYSNPSWGTGFTFALKDHADRQNAFKIVEELREKLKAIPTITAYVWNWDTGLPGFESDENGAELSIAVQTTHSYKDLSNQLEKLKLSLKDHPVLKDIAYDLQFDFPGYKARIDHQKMALLEVSIEEAASAMKVLFDQNESLEFFKDGLKYRIRIQGAQFADNLHEVDILNGDNKRIPLSTFMELERTSEPQSLNHYNRLRASNLRASLQPGKTLSDGINAMNALLEKDLTPGYTYSFIGSAKSWLDSSHTFLWLLLLAVLFIYGILAIQFESFVDPLIILVTVPLAAFGALFTLWIFGLELNIFGQIGLVTLIGLISKHGILLVDFANQTGSITEAVALRTRPILMTTAAMVLGAVPLMLATGAGSEARRAIGIVLVSGLMFGTALTLAVIPAVYGLLKRQD